MPCVHGNNVGSCPYCGPLYYPSTTTGTSTGSITFTPVPTPTQKERFLEETLNIALLKAKKAEEELEKANVMLHEMMSKETDWHDRIAALTAENATLKQTLVEVTESIDTMKQMVEAVLHGDAAWVQSLKQ